MDGHQLISLTDQLFVKNLTLTSILARIFSWKRKPARKPEQLSFVGDHMKYLIIGLGNIGDEYDQTRHNVGFEVVDYLARSHQGTFKAATHGSIAHIKHRGRQLILLKPSTYMNRSGKAVHYWAQKENISAERILVILDDLNLDFGHIRIRAKGSDGGHNGLKDINQYLGNNYARLRVGIGNQYTKGRQVDYVLGKWGKNELSTLPTIIQHSSDAILSYCFAGLIETMSQYNGEVKIP